MTVPDGRTQFKMRFQVISTNLGRRSISNEIYKQLARPIQFK